MKKKNITIALSLILILCVCGIFFFVQTRFTEDTNNTSAATPEIFFNESENIPSETIEKNSQENLTEDTIAISEENKSDISVTNTADKSLRVEGTGLVDSNGNPVQLRGISTHGINWFPEYVNETCFQELHENWNINVLRLALYTAEYNGYCSGGDKDNLKQLIKNGVNYATNQDMYVIIDWHVLTDLTPTLYKDEAKDFFAEMSAEFSTYDNVLYEICNEPNGGTSWSEVKTYAEEIIPVIRTNDEDAIIIVGTPNWSQYVNEAAANPITAYDNIMYALHFYAATHTDSLRKTLESAVEAGLPVFVTEYGISEASGDGAIDVAQADKWINLLDSYGISHVAWNLSNKAESSALLKSDCGKTAGFTENDLKDSGKWLYEMLTKQESVTLTENETSETMPTSKENEDNKSTELAPQDNPATNSTADHSITYTINLENSWEADGSTYYQYSLILTNTGDTKCTEWTISIPFDEVISLSNGWNGNYTVDDNTLHISSMDYNGEIGSGATIENIGFIIAISK